MSRVDPAACRAEDLADARDWLRAGGIVAYPTDTFYGLAVDPWNADEIINDPEVRRLYLGEEFRM